MSETTFIKLLLVLCNGGYSGQRVACHEFYINCGIENGQILSKPNFESKCVGKSNYVVGG